ncbi:HPr family phosphocarrier protein [Halorubrum sp. DTA46]|uniref:HPr family phosphocarrier protein n=1 Tax=Halorubrum sp. DTA46 TaxID=3402162 RepID=UPI003AAFD1C7
MERTVTVVPEAGLHARPASKLVQTVNRFDADVSIGRAGGDDGDDEGGDGLVRADSMLSVSGLNVAHGESVRVVAEGADAEDALDAVCELLESELDHPDDGGDENADDGEETDDGGDTDDGGETK